MKNILITIDGSIYSKKAMDKGKEIAKAFNSKVTLLNVHNSTLPYLAFEESQKYIRLLKDNSHNLLNEAKEYFKDFDGELELVSLEGDIANTIVEYVEDNNFDLVIMGSRGLSAGKVKGLLIGSITNKVIHQISKPILVVK